MRAFLTAFVVLLLVGCLPKQAAVKATPIVESSGDDRIQMFVFPRVGAERRLALESGYSVEFAIDPDQQGSSLKYKD